jgi:AraC-like DNA-binding protein
LEPFDVLWWHATTRGISLPVVRFATHLDVVHGGFVVVEPSPAAAVARAVMELRERRPQCDLLVRAIMLQLGAGIIRGLAGRAAGRAADQPAKSADARNSSWHVERVAEYIRTNYGADLTLERLAHLAGVSPYYLTTLFRRYLGRSAMTYVGEVRHRHACEMLRTQDIEVAEIARLVGYRDPYYFSRVFKAGEGCSPLAYRRRYRPVTPSAQH